MSHNKHNKTKQSINNVMQLRQKLKFNYVHTSIIYHTTTLHSKINYNVITSANQQASYKGCMYIVFLSFHLNDTVTSWILVQQVSYQVTSLVRTNEPPRLGKLNEWKSVISYNTQDHWSQNISHTISGDDVITWVMNYIGT